MATSVNGWIDVTDPSYGAIGNGVHDDTGAIQLAIAAIPTAGLVLYFPPGTYLISAALSTLPSGTRVQGGGIGVSTILSTATSSTILSIAGSSNVTVAEVSLSYSGTTTSGAAAISLAATATLSVANIRIIDVAISHPYTGVLIESYPTGGGAGVQTCSSIFCTRVAVILSASGASGFTIAGGGTNANQRIHFTDCTAEGVLGTKASWNVQNAVFVFLENCTSAGGSYGFLANPQTSTDAISEVQIANCQFSSNVFDGVHLVTTMTAQSVSALTFTNCHIALAAQNGVGTSMYNGPGKLQSIYALNFSGCSITENSGNGMSLVGVDALACLASVQIIGCNISSNCSSAPTTMNGILLENASNVIISGCSITPGLRPPSSGSQLNGVSVDSPSFNIAIEWTPEMFGAQGDGSDDTAAFSRALAAIATAGGGNLYLAASVSYTVDDAALLPLSVPAGAYIVGNLSTIETGMTVQASYTGYVVQLTNNGSGLRSLEVLSHPNSGASVSSTALLINASNILIDELVVTAGQCIEISGGTNIWIRDSRLHMQNFGTSPSGFNLSTTGACSNVHVKRTQMGADPSPNGYGVHLTAGTDLSFHVLDCLGCRTGLFVDAKNGEVKNCRFTDSSWDRNGADSAVFKTSSLGPRNPVFGCQFLDCWTSGADGGTGLKLIPEGGDVHDFQFSNHILETCGGSGVQIDPKTGSSVSGMLFGKLQNTACQGASGGIHLDQTGGGTIDGISFTGGFSGNFTDTLTPVQTNAVTIDKLARVTNALFLGLDVASTHGSPAIINNLATPPPSVWFDKCVDYNPVGSSTPSGSPGSTPVTNLTGVDQMIYITTGASSTVTSIEVRAFTTGLTLGNSTTLQIPLAAGENITVNKSGAVNWLWFGS